jgi:predicted amino acid-binding ACT domain protein
VAISIKKMTLWRKDALNNPGVLAEVLRPLAESGANLRVVIGYASAADPERASIELSPVSGKEARAARLAASPIACISVEGDDRPGLGAQIARAIADAGINVSFIVAQTVGSRFAAVLGFGDEKTAAVASKALRSLGKAARGGKKKPPGRKAPR